MPESLPGAGVSLFIWEVRKAKTQAGLARRVGTSLSPDQSKPRYAKACLFCASDSPAKNPVISLGLYRSSGSGSGLPWANIRRAKFWSLLASAFISKHLYGNMPSHWGVFQE